MSVLQSKIFSAGVTLSNEELQTIARAEALLRGDDWDLAAEAAFDERLEAQLEARRKAEKEKTSNESSDPTFGGLIEKI
jgi:hypothetical protein